jgi:hypothetical protein
MAVHSSIGASCRTARRLAHGSGRKLAAIHGGRRYSDHLRVSAQRARSLHRETRGLSSCRRPRDSFIPSLSTETSVKTRQLEDLNDGLRNLEEDIARVPADLRYREDPILEMEDAVLRTGCPNYKASCSSSTAR